MKNKYINSFDEVEYKFPEYWLEKMTNIEKYLFEEHKKKIEKTKYGTSSKKRKKIKEKKDFNVFEFAPIEILENQDLMLKALDDSFIFYFNLKDTLKSDRGFTLRYLNESEYAYYFCINEEFLLEEEIFNFCLKKDAKTYTSLYYKRNFFHKYGSKEQALLFLDINPKVYEYLGDLLKNDIDIAKKAVGLDLLNVQYMKKSTSAKVLKEKDLVENLLNKNLDFFVKINNKFRDDEEFLEPFIKQRPSLIEYVNPRLHQKREFIEKAITAYNLLEYIPDEYKKDEVLMLRHLDACPHSRHELAKHLNVTPLMTEVIKKHHYYYDYLNEKEKLEEDYIFALLEHQDFYKKNENIYLPYEKTNILQKLPEILQKSLKDEYLENHKKLNLSFNSNEELEGELLVYARNKYVNIYLEKSLRQEQNKAVKNKLKI